MSGPYSTHLRSQNDIREGPVLARKLLSVDATDALRRHPEMQEEFLTEARESNPIRRTGVSNRCIVEHLSQMFMALQNV